jgi:hypothetical protein
VRPLLIGALLAAGCASSASTPDAAPPLDTALLPPDAPFTPDAAAPVTADAAAPVPVDATSTADAAAPVVSSAEPPATAPDAYSCTLVLGVKETGEWFNAGFESIVENGRWEVVPIHNGHLELWADPQNGMWSLKPDSPCASNAAAPDRVIFCGVNYDYTTTAEFVPRYTAVIENIKARYPSVKRVDVMTLVRSVGNVPCPGTLSEKTWIRPAQDQSIAMVTAAYPGFVFASPRFEVRSCADFAMPPHFTGAAAMAAARTIGAFYSTH